MGNCGPYGCIPYTRDEYGVKDGCVSAANQRDWSFNKKLKPMLEELTKNLSGSVNVYADIYAVFLDIVQNYVSYGAPSICLTAMYISFAFRPPVTCTFLFPRV